MKAEIINIGDELLIGQIVNTNASWMAEQLNLAGIAVQCITVVADESPAIRRALENAGSRSQIALITGGLGPTKDDITKKVFAEFFGKKLCVNEQVFNDVKEFFLSRGKELTRMNSEQALVPEGCEVIRNTKGTAPGMWMKKENCIFISMPGVPYEMQTMLSEYVLPRLKSEFALPAIYHKSVLTQGIGESFLAEKIEAWEDGLKSKGIGLAYLPKPGIVRLRLSSSGNDLQALKQETELEIEKLKKIVPEYIFGEEEFGKAPESLERIVSELLRDSGKTLSLAESCTGGYITTLITSIAGASAILKGAVVPYTNEAKSNLLSVDPEIFRQHGAVSKECVEALAQGAKEKFASDYSIAVSGVAGPGGGTVEKPVGMVWIGYGIPGGVIAENYQFGTDRIRNIQMSANAALNGLRKILLGIKTV